jgi:hypothetical protein
VAPDVVVVVVGLPAVVAPGRVARVNPTVKGTRHGPAVGVIFPIGASFTPAAVCVVGRAVAVLHGCALIVW